MPAVPVTGVVPVCPWSPWFSPLLSSPLALSVFLPLCGAGSRGVIRKFQVKIQNLPDVSLARLNCDAATTHSITRFDTVTSSLADRSEGFPHRAAPATEEVFFFFFFFFFSKFFQFFIFSISHFFHFFHFFLTDILVIVVIGLVRYVCVVLGFTSSTFHSRLVIRPRLLTELSLGLILWVQPVSVDSMSPDSSCTQSTS